MKPKGTDGGSLNPLTGPEILTGSTRLKAGSATKAAPKTRSPIIWLSTTSGSRWRTQAIVTGTHWA